MNPTNDTPPEKAGHFGTFRDMAFGRWLRLRELQRAPFAAVSVQSPFGFALRIQQSRSASRTQPREQAGKPLSRNGTEQLLAATARRVEDPRRSQVHGRPWVRRMSQAERFAR